MQGVERVEEIDVSVPTSKAEEEIPNPTAPTIEPVAGSGSAEAVSRFDQMCCNTNDLFSRVQRLPAYTADPSKWKSLFFVAFSQFDQLWRYQQEQRGALNLRRSQIGEIGSRIAQLYLAYYLRTCQPRFVAEAFSFYEAILKRDYFEWQSQPESNRMTLVNKKLRALSRAVQVSMFLEDFRSAQDFLNRLTELVEREWGENRGEAMAEEFRHVPSELSSFLSALRMPIQEETAEDISPFHTFPTFQLREDVARFYLGPAVLVGGNLKHCRLLEFTIDHYMMFCFLKRVANGEDGPTLVHLHRLSTFLLLETLSSLSDKLPPSHAILLYLSAEARPAPSSSQQSPPDHTGSIILPEIGTSKIGSNPPYSQQLFLEDIYPFLRRPLLLLVDSPGFLAHADSLSLPSTFRQPLICLVAPSDYPVTIENHITRGGGLLTLFLSSPLLGLCLICGIHSLTAKLALKALEIITRVEDIGFSTLSSLSNLPLAYKQLCTDQTIQYIVKRFLFFWNCLRLHLGFKKEYHPSCYPDIPTALFHSSSLMAEYFELFAFLDVSQMFMDISHALDL